MTFSASTMTAIDLRALLKARLTAKKVNSVSRKSELKKPMLSCQTSVISSSGLA